LDELLNTLVVLDATLPGREFEVDATLRNPQIGESRDLQKTLEDALRSELELPPAPQWEF
jgi:hypothetical protein